MNVIYTNNAMNLRNVTIWTTGVMMVLTLLIPVGVVACGGIFNHNIDFYHNIDIVWLAWLLSGTPLLVSFILVITLKHKNSTVILLFSTIAYGAWFVYWSVVVGIHIGWDCYAHIGFYVIGPFSLPIMLPAWITALILNWRYAKKQELQV